MIMCLDLISDFGVLKIIIALMVKKQNKTPHAWFLSVVLLQETFNIFNVILKEENVCWICPF